MNFKSISYLVLIIFICVFSQLSCTKDPAPVNEEELITTLTFTLTSDQGESVVFNFSDKDGDGGQSPQIGVSGPLKKGRTYKGTLVLLNESVNPAKDITAEILAEAKEHQFFFEPSAAIKPSVSIKYDDSDGEGNPLGVKTTFECLSSGSGTLTIILRHEPDKKAQGVREGNPANAGGETDIQVTFSFEIKE